MPETDSARIHFIFAFRSSHLTWITAPNYVFYIFVSIRTSNTFLERTQPNVHLLLISNKMIVFPSLTLPLSCHVNAEVSALSTFICSPATAKKSSHQMDDSLMSFSEAGCHCHFGWNSPSTPPISQDDWQLRVMNTNWLTHIPSVLSIKHTWGTKWIEVLLHEPGLLCHREA